MFWNKSKSLTNEELYFRGRVTALMIILASGDFIDNHSGNARFWARSLAGIKDGGKLTEAEKDLAKELTYYGAIGLIEGAHKFFNDNNLANLFIGSFATTLKEMWPDHPATKNYFSSEANKSLNREILLTRVIESFINTYKDKTTIPINELKQKADQFLAEQMLSVDREMAKGILSMTDNEVQTIAKNIRG